MKAGLSSDGWVTLSIGLACASVTAFFAIYGLLHYLERRTTWIFVWYRLALGLALLAGLATGYLRN
jgi:undecaprenyl-diphosphatase